MKTQKQKTEYVATLITDEVLGSLTKREADELIRTRAHEVRGVDKKVWRDNGGDGWFELYAEEDYWFNPDAPEPPVVKYTKKVVKQ